MSLGVILIGVPVNQAIAAILLEEVKITSQWYHSEIGNGMICLQEAMGGSGGLKLLALSANGNQ